MDECKRYYDLGVKQINSNFAFTGSDHVIHNLINFFLHFFFEINWKIMNKLLRQGLNQRVTKPNKFQAISSTANT